MKDHLYKFFLGELAFEEAAGFPRLSRVPDTYVMSQLRYFRSLDTDDRNAFRDCSASWASWYYGFLVGCPHSGNFHHLFERKWSPVLRHDLVDFRSVSWFRSVVQQYKIDAARGVHSCVSDAEFAAASAIRSVKAAELRKRVRAALKPMGFAKIDELGYYTCRNKLGEFRVGIDYGGRGAQLRYCVATAHFPDVHPLSQFCFERALGFGLGDWDYIVEENVDDVMALFTELVQYCVELPDRVRAAVG